jgi:hypothetical protein
MRVDMNENKTQGAFDDLKKVFQKSENIEEKKETKTNLQTFNTTLNWLDPFIRFLFIALFIDYVATKYIHILMGHSKEMYMLNLAYLIYNIILRLTIKSIVIEDNNLYYTHTFGVRKISDIANYNCLIFPFINSFNMVKIIDKGGNYIILNGVKNINQLKIILEKNSLSK